MCFFVFTPAQIRGLRGAVRIQVSLTVSADWFCRLKQEKLLKLLATFIFGKLSSWFFDHQQRVSARVCDVEGGAFCCKNSTFGYFDGTAWTPSLRSPNPIVAPDYILSLQ